MFSHEELQYSQFSLYIVFFNIKSEYLLKTFQFYEREEKWDMILKSDILICV